MSSNVLRIRDLAPEAQPARADEYLGPARAVAVSGARVEVELPDGRRAPAELALAFPYRPAEGDTLLVINRGASTPTYVIGVLQGSGASVFSLPGDVGLHAGGALHLSGEKGVKVEGREVDLRGEKLRMSFGGVVQAFTSVFQRVTELLSVHAGESQTLVDESIHTQSKSATILTKETVTINGEQIHLG